MLHLKKELWVEVIIARARDNLCFSPPDKSIAFSLTKFNKSTLFKTFNIFSLLIILVLCFKANEIFLKTDLLNNIGVEKP